jgi:hypothetical protein
MFTLSTFFAAFGLTALLMIVALYYYTKGKQIGMIEAMQIIQEFEPKAFNRIHTKLKRKLNVE